MLQYLQSWFPGWGGWYGQQSPEGKPVEGLMAEPQEQWTPEEILGKAGTGFHVPFLITVNNNDLEDEEAMCKDHRPASRNGK